MSSQQESEIREFMQKLFANGNEDLYPNVEQNDVLKIAEQI
jgi:hypothetical protein